MDHNFNDILPLVKVWNLKSSKSIGKLTAQRNSSLGKALRSQSGLTIGRYLKGDIQYYFQWFCLEFPRQY